MIADIDNNLSQAQIIAKHGISSTSFKRISADKLKILSCNSHKFHLHHGKYPDMEVKLKKWILNCNDSHLDLSYDDVFTQAILLLAEEGHPPFAPCPFKLKQWGGVSDFIAFSRMTNVNVFLWSTGQDDGFQPSMLENFDNRKGDIVLYHSGDHFEVVNLKS